MSIEVIAPGPLSSFQDMGRHGEQKNGIFVGGAMDELSHRLANALVGNPADRATLEITLMGPMLVFHEAAVIAVCGADLGPKLDGEPLAMGVAHHVPAGGRLSFGQRKAGARSYLALAGGFRLDRVLGSESTSLKAKFGGFGGRAIAKGDRIEPARRPVAPARIAASANFAGPAGTLPLSPGPIRVLPGRHWDWFADRSRAAFAESGYKLLPQSSRMGYRLEGAPLALAVPREVISEPVRFGTVQVPADGQPIVLMADRQTIGGYARIAEVITADLPRLAQLSPGNEIRFEVVDLEAAETLLRERDTALAQVEVPMIEERV